MVDIEVNGLPKAAFSICYSILLKLIFRNKNCNKNVIYTDIYINDQLVYIGIVQSC